MTDRHLRRIQIISLIAFALLVSCEPTVPMDIQGHRGCRGLYPENTIAAFEKAIDLGVGTLELDIVISKDKKVVVSHEPFMNHLICLMPDGKDISSSNELDLNLYQMTYDEIKSYDCGSKRHPGFPDQVHKALSKPLLSDVFELARSKSSEVWFNIEIKSNSSFYGSYIPYPEEYVNIVMTLIQQQGMLSRVNIQSFDLQILEELHRQYPKVQIAVLVDEEENIDTKLSSLSFRPEIISPYYKLLQDSIVKRYQSDGYKVIPWTVNAIEDLQMVSEWGVDGIITDYPDRLIKLLE